MTRIFVAAYHVLYAYLMGNSRKNELYIAKYIDFFLTQFEIKEVRGFVQRHSVKPVLNGNSKKDQNWFSRPISKSIAESSPWILSTFIKMPFVFKTFFVFFSVAT